ncbi:MAG: hypothetical protein M3203_03430, partial [Actinomycetota bacterium]|nr:hypothetical protein [Actinomycetota bacterium]
MAPSHDDAGAPAIDAQRWLDAFRRTAAAATDAGAVEAAAATVMSEVCAAAGWPVARLLATAGGPVTPTGVWHLGDGDRFASLTDAEASEKGRAVTRLAQRAAVLGRPVWTADLSEVGAVGDAAWRVGLAGAAAFPVSDESAMVAVVEFFAARPERPPAAVLEMAAAAVNQLARV